jgi:hypothetical protein
MHPFYGHSCREIHMAACIYETTDNAAHEHNLIAASSGCEWRYGKSTESEDEMTETNDLMEHRIRERAFKLWQEAGRPEGQAKKFWNRARAIEAGNDTSESTGLVGNAGGHYLPTGDTQNFA